MSLNLTEGRRKALFQKARNCGMSGALFQNPMEIKGTMVLSELSSIDDARKIAMREFDEYAASVRMLAKGANRDT